TTGSSRRRPWSTTCSRASGATPASRSTPTTPSTTTSACTAPTRTEPSARVGRGHRGLGDCDALARRPCRTPWIGYEHTFVSYAEEVRMSVTEAVEVEPARWPTGALADALVDRARAIESAECEWLGLLAEFDRREGWRADGQLS